MTSVKLYLILFIGVVSVSFAAVFIRLADAPPLVIATYRMLIAATVITPFYMIRSRGLPQKLLKWAEIKRDVVVIGVLNRFEIWDEENWHRFETEKEKSYEEIAESLIEDMS